MDKEYLLMRVENFSGVEVESTIIVTQLIEKLERYYQWYSKLGYTLKVYVRHVGNWETIEYDKISNSD